jgi:DNA topoisomerase-6 subunit A
MKLTNQEAYDRLESLANNIIECSKNGTEPQITIPVRSLSNVKFNKKSKIIEMGDSKTSRQFFNLGMAKKFMQTILIDEALIELQRQENLSTSLREVYYRTKHTIEGCNENTFDGQDESDPIIEDLEVALSMLREELHVRASESGSIIGPVTIVEGGDTIDCTKMGKAGKVVPSIVEPGEVDIKKCTADFILLVEKGTQYNRLSEDKFWQKHNCILLTGNGQPPRGVRRLARRLHDECKLPVYVLVDSDPWGLYIYSVI